MKERPIIFSAPMVRAILNGSKTQTRRIMKPQPEQDSIYLGGWKWAKSKSFACGIGAAHEYSPYGKVGDHLWVRETFHTSLIGDAGTAISYKAGPELSKDEPWHNFTSDVNAYEWTAKKYKKNWMPSIHMPRWASRIQLEVLNDSVERLQDISNADAKAEGVETLGLYPGYDISNTGKFEGLWSHINGPKSWDANPWVWRIEFQNIERKQ